MVLWVSPWCWAIWLLFQDLFWLAFCLPIDLLCLSSRLLWLLRQDSRAMYPLFADCTQKGVSLAAFARNACFSRCSWQDLRPMYPFRGAIGRFRIHSARILPGKPPFCVEVPGIMHGAKILPTLGVARASPLRRAADREDSRHGRGRLLV